MTKRNAIEVLDPNTNPNTEDDLTIVIHPTFPSTLSDCCQHARRHSNRKDSTFHLQSWPTPRQQRAAMFPRTKPPTSVKRVFVERNATPKWQQLEKNAWPRSKA